MPNITVPSGIKRVKSLKHVGKFSTRHLLVFVVLFAVVGGYAVYRSFAASGPNVVATDGPEYNDSMVLGLDGNARISYTNTAGGLVFIHCLDTQCSSKNTSLVDSQGGNTHTSIAIGADGNARISYVYNNALKLAHCSNTDCTSSVITTVTSDPAATSLSVSSGSLALGSDGNARIIYTTKLAPYGNELRFVRCTNADCSTRNINTVVAPGASGSGAAANIASITPTLSMDSQDFGSFAYFEEDYSENPDWVSYLHCSNLDCSSSSSRHVWTDGGPASTTITQSIANAKGPFGSGQFSQVPDTRYFVVLGSGAVTVHFDYVYRESLCANQLQVFKVDDANGSINGILPGNSNWPAAVSSRNPQLVFNEGASSIGAGNNLTFQGGDVLAFRFVGCGNYYYSFDQADSDGKAHMLTYQAAAGQPWQMDWEDSSDFDYNDMAVNVTGVQGGTVTGVQGGSILASPLEEVSSTIGADGNPDIAFIWERDLIKDSYVRFLHCQDSDCATSSYSVVDNDAPGSLDAYHNGIALTVGPDNFARLAFTGSYSGQSALKYIRCTSVDCSTKVGPAIPVGTNTGHYPSLALSSASGVVNLPRISYLNMGTGNLEFAGCGDVDCNNIEPPVQPPTAPSNLTATPKSPTQIDLSWAGSTGVTGVAGYYIIRDGVTVATTDNSVCDSSNSCTYSDTNLTPNTSYTYQVEAFDSNGNISLPSNSASATTPAEPPTAPGYLLAQGVSNTQINLSWEASSSSIGIASYKIYENAIQQDFGDIYASPSSPVYIGTTTDTNYQVTGLQAYTSYSYYVVAIDTAGSISDPSNSANGVTTGATVVTCISSTKNRCLSGTSWPYASPFGDDPSTCASQCRPMTVQTCKNSKGVETSATTLTAEPIDQGVDYQITPYVAPPVCTYSNPNPADTGTTNNKAGPGAPATGSNSITNTRVYAMGPGKIVCVAGNTGFGETTNLPKSCPGSSQTLGSKEGTWLVYQLTSGPAKGLDIYVAEGCTISNNAVSSALGSEKTLGRRWSDGRLVINGKKIPADNITANSVLCEVSNGSIETGWANDDTQYNLNSSGQRTDTIKNALVPAAYTCENFVIKADKPTEWGLSFNEFIVQSGGLSGVHTDPIKSCANYPMPAKYANPDWYKRSNV